MDEVLEFLRSFIAGGSNQDFKPWASELYEKLYRSTDEPIGLYINPAEPLKDGETARLQGIPNVSGGEYVVRRPFELGIKFEGIGERYWFRLDVAGESISVDFYTDGIQSLSRTCVEDLRRWLAEASETMRLFEEELL